MRERNILASINMKENKRQTGKITLDDREKERWVLYFRLIKFKVWSLML